MADKKQTRILKKGVVAWNKWREKHPNEKIEIERIDLRGADLTGINLRNV
jgi:uncharacterized protein YjbI with pentapeptide repeats